MKKQNGQAIIEFAIILPLFVLFLFGIIYSGMLFYDYISLSNLARSAAREAAVVQTLGNNEIQSIERYYTGKAQNLLTHLYEPAPLDGENTFKIEQPTNDLDSVMVTVKMERNVSSGLMEIILPDDYTIIYLMRRDGQSSGNDGSGESG